jgi:hypothetical protein
MVIAYKFLKFEIYVLQLWMQFKSYNLKEGSESGIHLSQRGLH